VRVFSTSVRQRRTTRPTDLPYGEVPLVVRWHKRQCACRERSCLRTAFTESIAELPPYARITGRTAEASIGTGRSVRAVCAELPMSWPTAHAAFVDHAERLLTEPVAPEVLGIDETRRGRPRWSRNDNGSRNRLERFETNFVDLSGSGGLLGQTAGWTAKSVVAWLDERGEGWKAQVEFVAIDPCATYRSGSSTRCRRPGSSPTTSTSTGSPGKWSPTSASASFGSSSGAAAGPPIPRGPTGGCCCARRRPPRALDRLRASFTASSDPTGEIRAAWGVKERFRSRSRPPTGPHRRSAPLLHETVLAADLPEATRLALTVDP
jgi:hypothetical protein